MLHKKILLPLFVVMVIAQWYIPGHMIWEKEEILVSGKAYKFKIKPIDPSHPLKGKYIRLVYEEDSFTVPEVEPWMTGQEIYIVLTTDEAGYAQIKSIHPTAPHTGKNNYFKVRSSYYTRDCSIQLNYPFDEFYMNEFKAPKAEKLQREMTLDSTKNVYALVLVKDGSVVLKEVEVDGIPISEFLNTN